MPAKGGSASGGKCKDFSLDLMHLSTNEIEEIKDLPALKEHIKKCPACRKKLGELRDVDVFSFLAKPRSPEYQAKMNKLLERVKSESGKSEVSRPVTSEPVRPKVVTGSYPALVGLPPPRDTDWEIGLAAREIYNCLKTNGPIPIPLVRMKTRLTDYPFRESVGWLAREGKIAILGDPKTGYASLNPGR